jgi:pimeloyl-ACP methyl ester carboxylesterase
MKQIRPIELIKPAFKPWLGGWMIEKEIGGFGSIAGRWPLDKEKSTIVFIHGSGGTGHFWKAQVEGLSERVNTVAIDLPGHGRSREDGKNTIADYARAVVQFVDAIEVSKAIPCGLSLGGAIAQQLLLDYPALFNAGILVGTGAKLKVLPAIFEAIESDYPGLIDMLVKFASSRKTDPAVLQVLRNELGSCEPGVVYGDFQACHKFNVMQRLVEISVPVLIISAEDDQLTPPKFGEFLESGIPNATRTHIMDAGHIAPMEKPEEVNQAIAAFLDSQGF